MYGPTPPLAYSLAWYPTPLTPLGRALFRTCIVVGAAHATDLSDREREICATVGPKLRELGLLFVGIDVIDGNLTEINVTSPTGIRAIKRLGGPDLAVSIWECIEDKIGRG